MQSERAKTWELIPVPREPYSSDRRRWSISSEGGVYAIYVSGELVYIGSSGNLRRRVAKHFTLRHWSYEDAVVKVSLCYENWLGRERRLVKRLRPRDNRQWLHRTVTSRPGRW